MRMHTITGSTIIAGVFGWPVSHSASPKLHNYWLAEHKVDGAYVPFPVEPKNLEGALRALPALGIRGVNITIPYKEAAFRLVDHLDLTAQKVGAINTVVVQTDGTLEGQNTDVFGFSENLRTTVPGWDLLRGPGVILGAGGAARSIAFALHRAGFKEIRVVARKMLQAENIAKNIGPKCIPVDWREQTKSLEDAHLLVNTTPMGMKGRPWENFSIDSLPKEAIVNDIVYRPIDTKLLRIARKRGNKIVDGLGMLLYQAKPAFEAWFGVEPTVSLSLRKNMSPKE